MSLRYLVRRLMLLISVMWTAATINFLIPKLSPRDPIQERLQQAANQGGRVQTGLQDMVAAYQKAGTAVRKTSGPSDTAVRSLILGVP